MSRDSSISSPRAAITSPSTTTWLPDPISRMSSRTTSFTASSRTSPSRTTLARGAVSTASRSSVRLARTSWKIPIAEFSTMTTPNSASCRGPTIRISTSIDPRSALNRVRTLARTISLVVLLGVAGTSFTCPRARRSATWAALSPASPAPASSTRSVATSTGGPPASVPPAAGPSLVSLTCGSTLSA